eukprot:TRINITY_DN77025_c0_g1_i1.p1 TRINITY_DN77025_c0_g1~~TRINITY_DN77025_c0_g1_i1.p1  ORF type:complete len:1413 (+),score=223.84 TRINITY_DN77025_c0_g1_i1:44-4282(+)
MGACHALQPLASASEENVYPNLLADGKCPVSGQGGAYPKCPVSGASGSCPFQAKPASPKRTAEAVCPVQAAAEAAEASPSTTASNGSKVSLSELPKAPPVSRSDNTHADLKFIKSWPVQKPLSNEDIVVVKGAWNRTLGFKDATMEAMIYRWTFIDPEIYDLLQFKFDELPHDIFQMIDKSVRALDKRTEVHHRESYTAGFPACVTRDFGDDPADIMSHYTLMGVRPKHWALLKEAFLFAMRTHNPYLYKDHDGADLDQGEDGAIARFFHIHVVQKAHGVLQKLIDTLESPDAVMVQRQAVAIKPMLEVGEDFYRRLLTKYPELCDYFARADMDNLAQHLQQTLAVVGIAGVGIRDVMAVLSKLAAVHREAMVPTDAYPKVGDVLVETLSSKFEMTEGIVKIWVFTYMYCASVISAPMAVEERLYADAVEFFSVLAAEGEWGSSRLDARLNEVKTEISLCGTYRHTTEELQAGAKQAWRNAPKCIGRIAWDTLVIRDCRHVTSEPQILQECQEHLRLASNKGIVQSLMTIFPPKKPNERWGPRFWNTQFCRYAGYRQADGSVLGDPANVEFTEMVIDRFGWKPPKKRTRFDPLPQIVQLPDQEPYMSEFPRELFCEIPIEHPKYSKFGRLGLKWTSLPCINNFNLRIGGVDYPCCPFNGWFVDLEIARNLVERYDIGADVAKICGFDTTSNSSGWRSMVLQTVSAAVTHSFQKKKFSIVDHYTVSTQFLTHVDREKRCGREVPAQWSWIGGFAGVHCPVWHYEMRDFYLRPQYHYNCDKWVVEEVAGSSRDGSPASSHRQNSEKEDPRKVLIYYASSTGSAQQYAQAMAKELGLAYRPRVMDLNSFNEETVKSATHVLFFVSTFNDGSPPRNGNRFPDALLCTPVNEKTQKPVKYAVMALGSSIYPKFCAFGKKVDKVLGTAGAIRFVSTVQADDCKDQAADFVRFMAATRNELEPRPAPPDTVEAVLEVTLGRNMPLAEAEAEVKGHMRAEVVSSEQLLENSSRDRSTRKICIDISRTGMSYQTGGHLSVYPCNPHDEIVELTSVLGIPEERIHAKIEAMMVEGQDRYPASLGYEATTLYDTLRWQLDITVRPGNVVRILSMVRDAGGMTTDEYDVLVQQGSYNVAARFWWVSRLLQAFPLAKGKITLAALLTTLSTQCQRIYSIASSSLVSPNVVELCVSLLCIGGKHGLASGYLHSLDAGSSVLVSTHSSHFCLAESLEAPMIMVGCGTGVAPFVGFAQERMRSGCSAKESGKSGKAQLFFGARCEKEVLHKELFEAALDAGALTAYDVSLSRELGQPKRHVTDGLINAAETVWELLQRPDCHYYACGDGAMADSAYNALISVIIKRGKMSRTKAMAFMDNMRTQGRYHLDVWGVITHTMSSVQPTRLRQNKALAWLKMIQDTQESEDA